MIPIQVRRIGEVEQAVIREQNSLIWDIIGNDIVRHKRFCDIPANIQELYANVGNFAMKLVGK